MQKKSALHFPKKFLWGVATSAHQVEGGTHNQWTVWELENASSIAAQSEYQYGHLDSWPKIAKQAKRPQNYVSERATDHYRLYEEDFDLLKKLNMNAFRFSIEWSRVEPDEGAWNVEAVEHYKQYVKSLKRRGITPVVTLFHFSLPLWFTAQGGFEKRSNVKYFTRFAKRMLEELGRDVKYVVTINEPSTYAREGYLHGNWPPAKQSKLGWWRVMNNLALAHRQVADYAHDKGRYRVAVAENLPLVYPGDDALLTRKYAAWLRFMYNDYFLRKVAKKSDFIGVNYYFSDRVYGYRIHNPDDDISDMGWDMNPADIGLLLERLHTTYRLPLFVTENGVADADDEYRKWWLTQTLMGMQNAMDAGVVLEGYLHWSLTDNFEWDKGRWPRFGLAAVDYKTMERTLRPSAIWFGKVIKHLQEGAK